MVIALYTQCLPIPIVEDKGLPVYGERWFIKSTKRASLLNFPREYLSKLKQYPHLFFFKPTGAPLSLSNLSGTTGGKMSLTAARVMSDQLTSCHVFWGGSSHSRGLDAVLATEAESNFPLFVWVWCSQMGHEPSLLICCGCRVSLNPW